jgi:hypothetical protein
MLPPSERLPNYLDSLGGYKNINNTKVQHDDSKSINSIS